MAFCASGPAAPEGVGPSATHVLVVRVVGHHDRVGRIHRDALCVPSHAIEELLTWYWTGRLVFYLHGSKYISLYMYKLYAQEASVGEKNDNS
jgi:hypothetical protein